MMQKKVQIISDGSLDLSQELTKEKDIEVVPFYVSFDSETYQKEMVEVGVREFYQEMVDHPTVFPKTSMPWSLTSAFTTCRSSSTSTELTCVSTRCRDHYHEEHRNP